MAANQKADARRRVKRRRARAGRQAQVSAAAALMAPDDAVHDCSVVREPRSRVEDGGAQRVLVVAQDARHSGRARREVRHADRVKARPIAVLRASSAPGGWTADTRRLLHYTG